MQVKKNIGSSIIILGAWLIWKHHNLVKGVMEENDINIRVENTVPFLQKFPQYAEFQSRNSMVM
jgi:hypothetical protein